MAELYIGICDDQLEIAQILKENIESIQVKRDKRWKIEIFTSGEALLEVVKALDVHGNG